MLYMKNNERTQKTNKIIQFAYHPTSNHIKECNYNSKSYFSQNLPYVLCKQKV
ncbi:hypothetical protein KFK09_003990 [Dendrobium nobile]|uniref:Uncharacterized protein n=1 Tax=Dendrobium nobile TaxID=94219 RepID=A0A8T3C1L6_DENNO|nr:hypothetical protein KFK09_003990 [Dendrobium nobile]